MSVPEKMLTLVCRWHRGRLSLLAADALAEGESVRVRAHLDHCAACQKRFAELRAVAELGRQLRVGMEHAEITAPLPRAWEQRIRARDRGPVRGVAHPPHKAQWAWGGLAAAWLVIALLRWTAPGVSSSDAGPAPISWVQVRMILDMAGPQVEARRETPPLPRRPLPAPPKTRRDRDQGAAFPSDNPRRMA